MKDVLKELPESEWRKIVCVVFNDLLVGVATANSIVRHMLTDEDEKLIEPAIEKLINAGKQLLELVGLEDSSNDKD